MKRFVAQSHRRARGWLASLDEYQLAISLAIAAAQYGRRVYYSTLADLVASLAEAKAAGSFKRRLPVFSHPLLLIVDEIDYIPISQTVAMLFFQLMSRRYEHASAVVTSNKGFDAWGDILGEPNTAECRSSRSINTCDDRRPWQPVLRQVI